MKQVLQSLADGRTIIADVPDPALPADGLLVATQRTLISAGTERMLVEFGRAGWIDRARQQPDKVRQVIDRIAADGLLSTVEAVRSKLDQPIALGYCNTGVVLATGRTMTGVVTGDRVVSNGPHAEVVAAARNLCAKVPDGVTDDEAAFTVLGSIALQGLRLAAPTLGEHFVVIGLGLIGLITVQLLRANGCSVLGVDPDARKCELARQFGASTVQLTDGADPVAVAGGFSRGRGVDGVIITAATASNEPVSQAAQMCRKRGRIILVGVAGLQLNRAEFFEKELVFQVSCSYGPGRYDPAYENQGNDYPIGFVRWTEQRNFEAILDMLASKRLDVGPLITHRFAFDDAPKAYDLLAGGHEPFLGILLTYPAIRELSRGSTVLLREAAVLAPSGRGVIGVIGAGNYAGRVLVPALARTPATLRSIASAGGVTAAHIGRKYGFALATTDVDKVLNDAEIDTVIVATRHAQHADLACRALAAGKHVFVEKPLALTIEDVERVQDAQARSGKLLCVGFNRRFAPLVVQAQERISQRTGPLAVVITVNAGALPASHWTKDPRDGGGRIVGEACHFIDLARALVGHPIWTLNVAAAGDSAGPETDIALLQIGFADGSVASVQYLSNGNRRFPKERVELFWDGKTMRIDNFREIAGWGVSLPRSWGFARQDKGNAALIAAFVTAVRAGGPAPIPLAELFEVSRWAVEAQQATDGKSPQ